MKAARKFGFELEYASNTNHMIAELHRDGLMLTSFAHDYHCTCPECAYTLSGYQPEEDHDCDDHCNDYGCWNEPRHSCDRRACPRRTIPERPARPLSDAPDLRAQRDSTADGEFITRPLDDWDDLQRIAEALTTAATNAGATANARCGLHVHVDTSSDIGETNRYGEQTMIELRLQRRRTVPAAYLAFERYFTEIVAPGASVRKRDMNSTLMEAVRSNISNNYSNPQGWMDMGRGAVDDHILSAINMDRHVDLNWSRRNSTWEFRAMNATNAPWRIELACRMAVAFVEATPQLRDSVESVVRGSKFWPVGCDSPWGEIIRPAFKELPSAHPTKKPVVPFPDFVDILCDVDADLRPLIERQSNFMRTRWAVQVEHAS